MRSCDSDSMISYGVIPVSRAGTFDRSISTPLPARPAISNVEDVRPAAPMSWMPTTASVWKSSRHASMRSFSVKGSPTCTVGRFCFASSAANSSEAIVAPWMPSRPVFEPTYTMGLPAPSARPRKMRSLRTMPRFMTLTRMLPS